MIWLLNFLGTVLQPLLLGYAWWAGAHVLHDIWAGLAFAVGCGFVFFPLSLVFMFPGAVIAEVLGARAVSARKPDETEEQWLHSEKRRFHARLAAGEFSTGLLTGALGAWALGTSLLVPALIGPFMLTQFGIQVASRLLITGGNRRPLIFGAGLMLGAVVVGSTR